MANDVSIQLLSKGAAQVKKDLDQINSAAGNVGQKLGAVGRGMTMGVTAPIVAGFAMAVKAGAEEQQQMEVLANTMRNTAGATDEQIKANEDWITSMQNATGVADGELRNAMNHLLVSGMSVEDSQKNMAIAMDIAKTKGLSVEAVTKAMARANNGNVGALGKLGIATKNAAGETMTMDEILKSAADTMGGAAAAAADTAAGRAEIMKLKMADLAENVGMILIPIMEKLVGWLSKIVDWFNNMSPAGKGIVVTLLGVAAAVGPVLMIASKLIGAFKMVGQAFGVLSKLMAMNPWVLLIAAVVALVVLIVMNWDKIVAFLKKTWDWIKKTAGAVWEWVVDKVKAAADFLVKLFLNWTLVGLIIKHWDKIKAGVTAVKDWIVDKWNAVIDFFKGIPDRIGRAVHGLFDGLKNAFRNAVNWIIDKWNGFRLQIKLPGLLGGGTIGIDTPNIPRLHSGGIFRAPSGQREGLALLSDGERVSTPGSSGGELVAIVHVHGDVVTYDQLVDRVRRGLIEIGQRNGTIFGTTG